MTYSISKDFHFSASHRLDGLPADHQCSRLHGHNYLVRLVVKTEDLDEVGFVVDYGKLAGFGDHIDQRLDHRHLNDVLPGNPTAENLARRLAAEARRCLDVSDCDLRFLISVGVSETPKTWAWWTE
jgi:6-pyruvoyltetrahydropterin/6-carboxytetrahydropterin synthase